MGSIEKRGEGSYRLSVVIGYEENGAAIRRRKSIKARNKTEAARQLTLFESEILSGHYIQPEQMTLQAFVTEWQDKYAAPKFAPDTYKNYNLLIASRILPMYGRMKLSEFKPIHVVNLLEDLRKPGRRLDGKDGVLSPATIHTVYKAFYSLLDCAYQWRLIKENPAASIKAPKVPKKKSTLHYRPEMVYELIEAIESEPMDKRLIFWMAFVTSARQSEIAALEEKHIDKERLTVTFEQSLTEVRGKGIQVKSIKNNLTGEAAIPEELMQMIEQLLHQRRLAKMKSRNFWEGGDSMYLFSNEFGKPMRPDSISQWWRRFIQKNQLEPIRFHDLRHLSITFLIGKNVPMKSISERARHSNIGTTMDIYGHTLVEIDRLAASHFSEFFHKKEAEK